VYGDVFWMAVCGLMDDGVALNSERWWMNLGRYFIYFFLFDNSTLNFLDCLSSFFRLLFMSHEGHLA